MKYFVSGVSDHSSTSSMAFSRDLLHRNLLLSLLFALCLSWSGRGIFPLASALPLEEGSGDIQPYENVFADEGQVQDVPHIPVGPTHKNQDDQNKTTKSPTPVVPVTTPPPAAPDNTTAPDTPAPTNEATPAPSTPAPSNSIIPAPTKTPDPKPTPTPAPTKKYPPEDHNSTEPTIAPTVAPSKKDGGGGGGFSFFRMIGKMIAWMIMMGLAVLLYGFCINNRYQIAYYTRHAGHFCQSCYRYLMMKVGGAQRGEGYHAMYQSNDGQTLNSLLFDAPGAGDPNDGFMMGQPSVNYQQLG